MTDLAAGRAATAPAEGLEQLEAHRIELTGLLLPDARLGLRGRGRGAGHHGPGLERRSTGSRAGPRCAPGSTGSPPTSASTRWTAGRSAPCRWTWARRSRPTPPSARRCPRSPGSQPIPDARVVPAASDPAEVAELREIGPARLRRRPAAPAAEAAGRADPARGAAAGRPPRWPSCSTPPSRRSTARCSGPAPRWRHADVADSGEPPKPLDEEQRELLARYVDAFERYDMTALTSLLTEDATLVDAAVRAVAADPRRHHEVVPRAGQRPARGRAWSRPRPTAAPAFAQYKPDPNGGHSAWSLQVLEVDGDQITGIIFFLDVEAIYPLFDLPLHLDA